MRAVLAAMLAALTVAGGVAAGGCVIFTGSTDGYGPHDAGGDGGAAGDSAGSFACVSAADCGDGGAVCCIVENSSFTSANFVCQAAPCSLAQQCLTTAECGKAGPCTRQVCTFGAATVSIWACGVITPYCTAQ
jgi:hypothetical protein